MHTVTVAELPTLETTALGPGRWQEISQQQIDQFAHGYLTLSLVPVPIIDGGPDHLRWILDEPT